MPSAEPKNIPLSGPEWQPPGYDLAPPSRKRRWWVRIGAITLGIKKEEVLEGIGKDGRRLKPVVRPSGGLPLVPHDESSRTYRLLTYRAGSDGATLYWKGSGRESWSTILGYHAYKHGPRSLPVRNTIGISPKGRREAMRRGIAEWESWGRSEGISESVKRMKAEIKRKAEAEAERKAKVESERRAKAEAARKAKAEAARKAKAEAARRAEAEAARRAKAETARKSEPEIQAAGAGPIFDLRERIKALRARPDFLPSQARAAVQEFIKLQPAGVPISVKEHGMASPESLSVFQFEGIDIYHTGDTSPAGALHRTLYSMATGVGGRSEPIPGRIAKATNRIILTAQENKDDPYWRKVYNNPEHKSLATGSGRAIVVYNGSPIGPSVFAHESGHSLAQDLYGGYSPKLGSDYAKAMASEEQPVSDYARASDMEDFAESVMTYVTDHDKMKAENPLRYGVIHRLMTEPGYGG